MKLPSISLAERVVKCKSIWKPIQELSIFLWIPDFIISSKNEKTFSSFESRWLIFWIVQNNRTQVFNRILTVFILKWGAYFRWPSPVHAEFWHKLPIREYNAKPAWPSFKAHEYPCHTQQDIKIFWFHFKC